MALASIAAALLMFAASHARVDRTHRQPVVSWTGPTVALVLPMAVVGWLLTVAAGLLALGAAERSGRIRTSESFGLLLVTLNVLGSFLFYIFVSED